jgi:DNA-binding IclR family transcriptional regulator
VSSPRIRFTDQQGQYLAFIDAYTRVHGRPPAEADLQRHFRVSPPAVHRMVLTLERAGLIRRQPGLARSIGVLYRPYEVVTDAGSQGKLVSERSRPGSARSAFQAAQAASTTAS